MKRNKKDIEGETKSKDERKKLIEMDENEEKERKIEMQVSLKTFNFAGL